MSRLTTLLTLSAMLCLPAAGQITLKHFDIRDIADRAWLGVMVRDASGREAGKAGPDAGALVTEVVDDSPAESAGLREGDVITGFGDRPIDDSDDLVRAVRRADPGDSVKITVDRKGDRRILTAKLERMKTPRAFSFTVPPVHPAPRVAPRPFRFDMSGRSRIYGLEVQDLGKQLGEYFEVPGNRGVLVASVKRGSPAGEAGVKAGDVIVRVNGNTVLDTDDLLDEFSGATGGKIPLDVIRKGRTVTLELPRPADEDDSGLSLFFHDGDRWLREDHRDTHEDLILRRDLLDDIREGLLELREGLRERAVEIRDAVRRELRNL